MHHRIAIVLLMTSAVAQGASFDCKKAATAVERMICADAELSRLDDTLAETYSTEIEREVAAPRFKASQKTWLLQRNQCVDIACVKARYEQRIAELTCDSQSRMAGSAIGTIQCTVFSLRALEPVLDALEAQYGRKVSEESNNPEYTMRAFLAEKKAWREYREAQCVFYGATEGGSDGWKNAFARTCELDETSKRIARFQSELGSR